MNVQESDKEKADRLDAEDRLRARGYAQTKCEACRGFGGAMSGLAWYPCGMCDGRGFHWQAPITK